MSANVKNQNGTQVHGPPPSVTPKRKLSPSEVKAIKITIGIIVVIIIAGGLYAARDKITSAFSPLGIFGGMVSGIVNWGSKLITGVASGAVGFTKDVAVETGKGVVSGFKEGWSSLTKSKDGKQITVAKSKVVITKNPKEGKEELPPLQRITVEKVIKVDKPIDKSKTVEKVKTNSLFQKPEKKNPKEGKEELPPLQRITVEKTVVKKSKEASPLQVVNLQTVRTDLGAVQLFDTAQKIDQELERLKRIYNVY